MNYEYAIRDYDRTPEGNIPKKYSFSAKTDLQAFAIAFYNIYQKGATNKEIIQNLIEEDILDESYTSKSSREVLNILCNRENENIDPSDAFIFYIYNIDKDKYIYENDYCDVEDWIRDLVMGGEWDPEYAQTFIDEGWDYDFLLEMAEDGDDGYEESFRRSFEKSFKEKLNNRFNFSTKLKEMMDK